MFDAIEYKKNLGQLVMSKLCLVVIGGPVGGGKSTTAISLAAHLRSHDITTAVIDLDDVYRIGRQLQDRLWNEPDVWAAARRGCGALAESFFGSGYDVVIAEGGDFDTIEACKELRTSVQSPVDIRFFTLVVSWEETFRRAQSDPNRNIVTKSGLIKNQYDHFISSMPFLRDISDCIDADNLEPDQIAAYIGQAIGEAK